MSKQKVTARQASDSRMTDTPRINWADKAARRDYYTGNSEGMLLHGTVPVRHKGAAETLAKRAADSGPAKLKLSGPQLAAIDAVAADNNGQLPIGRGGLLRPIEFGPEHSKPRAPRRGSKTDVCLRLAMRECGATLYDVAEALSQTGANVTPSYARAWLARSYYAPLGYGLYSAVDVCEHGPVLRVWAYVADDAALPGEADKAATRRDTEQGVQREADAKAKADKASK